MIRTILALLIGLTVMAGPAQARFVHSPFGRPMVADAALSPDGDRLAMAVWTKNTQIIAILDAETGALQQSINIGVVYADWLSWANDDRVLIGVSRARRVAGVFKVEASRVVSLNPSGDEAPIVLLQQQADDSGAALSIGRVVDFLPDDAEHVLLPGPAKERTALYRVNVYTGEARIVAEGGRRTYGFVTDGTGEVRIRFDQSSDGRTGLVMRRDADGDWTRIRKVRFGREWADTAITKDFRPVTARPGHATVLSVARPDGEDRIALWAYDYVADRFTEWVAGPVDGDVDDAIMDARTGALLGYVTTNRHPTPVFLDDSLQDHATALQDALGEDTTIWFRDVAKGRAHAILYVSAPTDPGAYYIYDFQDLTLKNLGAAYGKRDALYERGPTRLETYTARDGTVLEAYVTDPSGGWATSGAIPLVVMPHGGPEARDMMTYNPVVQKLASAGYRVVRPYFRGSTGKGRAFAEAGYGEWGGVMHEDVVDAVTWAHDAGLGQPRHTCMMGASYGAYASLLVAARRPDLVSCAVALSGPSDLVSFMRDRRRVYGASSDVYDYWTMSLGGPAGIDKARLRAASPISYTKNWTVPTLLVHGLYDTIVPFDQSDDLYDKLKRRDGLRVELLRLRAGHQLGGEGPSAYATDQSLAFMEDFIGRGAAATASAQGGDAGASR